MIFQSHGKFDSKAVLSHEYPRFRYFWRSASFPSLQIFLLTVVLTSIRRFSSLFWQTHGWKHRTCGGFNLLWLVLGCVTVPRQCASTQFALIYDMILAGLGITSTLTAARDFPHRYVANAAGQSGTLSNRAVVTNSEMMEHSFYQGINLCQALYLHHAASKRNHDTSMEQSMLLSWLALLGVTAPWWVRRQFPVNSFSGNWKQRNPNDDTNSHEIQLYRIKKAQYLFGKHVILHGLNLTICCTRNEATAYNLATSSSWRMFWICLNAAYVMEFFLQSLVKRTVIAQSTMLSLNHILMAISSIAALESVLQIVRWDFCIISLALNFYHRGHDVFNTMLIATVVMTCTRFTSSNEHH